MPAAPAEATGQEFCRQVFDDLSIDAITFLESHPKVAGVKFYDRPSATQAQLQAWEAQNSPFVLPEDFKAFFAISDGVTLRWSLRFRGEAQPFGTVHVNQLEQVQRLPGASLQGLPGSSGEATAPPPKAGAAALPAAFDLDAECADGKVALVYRDVEAREGPKGPAAQPQVWFQDLSCQWHFLAGSFTDYFRLLATHLGVPQWHYAFTDVGLGPAARHWLAFFCPERLAVATERRSATNLPCTVRRSGSRHKGAHGCASAPGTSRLRRRQRERPSSSARRPGSSGRAHYAR
mmetsp:Transcript_133778/g.372964  ORF Transcript_133778/g.372964 Transcript_133778/m.372964 type:complete len:291 (+) Transcript_133778:108-980(+)